MLVGRTPLIRLLRAKRHQQYHLHKIYKWKLITMKECEHVWNHWNAILKSKDLWLFFVHVSQRNIRCVTFRLTSSDVLSLLHLTQYSVKAYAITYATRKQCSLLLLHLFSYKTMFMSTMVKLFYTSAKIWIMSFEHDFRSFLRLYVFHADGFCSVCVCVCWWKDFPFKHFTFIAFCLINSWSLCQLHLSMLVHCSKKEFLLRFHHNCLLKICHSTCFPFVNAHTKAEHNTTQHYLPLFTFHSIYRAHIKKKKCCKWRWRKKLSDIGIFRVRKGFIEYEIREVNVDLLHDIHFHELHCTSTYYAQRFFPRLVSFLVRGWHTHTHT